MSWFSISNYIIMVMLIEAYGHLIRSRNAATKAVVENNFTRLVSPPSALGFCVHGILDQSRTYFAPSLGIRVMSEMFITVIIVLSSYFVSGHEIKVTFNPFRAGTLQQFIKISYLIILLYNWRWEVLWIDEMKKYVKLFIYCWM